MPKEVVIPHNFNPAERPFQLEVLRNPARFKFLKIHRKAGKTALLINKANIKMMKCEGIGWYVAPTYTQGKEIVWRDPAMLNHYTPPEIVRKKNESELTIQYVSGSTLAVKGADKPDSLRGPNPKFVALDEVYFQKREMWEEILLPIAMANPEMEIWLVGTPKPMGRFWEDLYRKFEQEMKAGNPNYFAMTLGADTSGILSPEMLAEAKATMTQAAYEQEMLCVFHGEDGTVFRGIERCIIDRDYREEIDNRCTYKFGVDLARVKDWTVLTGINKVTHIVDYFDRFNEIDYKLQKARIEATLRRYHNATATVDSTGVGDPIVEDLAGRGLNVSGFQFTEQTKGNLISNLALAIEQGKVRFPRIPQLIDELQVFGYEVTPAGRIRYGAPDGFHDDCVISLALAWWEIGSRLAAGNTRQTAPVASPNNRRKFL